MKVVVKQFGEMLISRPAGRDAYLTATAYIFPKDKSEEVEFDFEGVAVLAPSWADEFITLFINDYPGKARFTHTENPSVAATLKTLGIH